MYVVGAFDYNDDLLSVKVGVSNDVGRRIATIQTGQFCEVKLLTAWRTESRMRCFHAEKSLHIHYENRKMRGEWFRRAVMRDIIPLASDLMGSLPCAIPGVDSFLKDVQYVAERNRERMLRHKAAKKERKAASLLAA